MAVVVGGVSSCLVYSSRGSATLLDASAAQENKPSYFLRSLLYFTVLHRICDTLSRVDRHLGFKMRLFLQRSKIIIIIVLLTLRGPGI